MESAQDSPTARALRTLELLQRRPGSTADDLAANLGVSDRAARRYVAILREAGIVVDSVRGPGGGYRLGPSLRPPPLVFTAAETIGLVMAVLDGQHAAADPEDPVGRAVGKLIAALPANVARPAAVLRAHAVAAPARWRPRPHPDVTSRLVEAIAAQRRVHLSYRPSSGRAFEVDADPWAVVVRGGVWYLLCHVIDRDAVRSYRVDRIEGVRQLNVEAVIPDDLDPVAALERHLGLGWPYLVHVEFDAPLADVAPYLSGPMGRARELDGGARCELVGTTNQPDGYAGERLAGIPFPCRVIGGPELRAAVAALGARLSAAAV